MHDDNVAQWVDSSATSHVFKDLSQFKECQPVKDGSVAKMGNVETKRIKGLGRVLLNFTYERMFVFRQCVVYVTSYKFILGSQVSKLNK